MAEPVMLLIRRLPYREEEPYIRQWFASRDDAVRAVRLLALYTGRRDMWRLFYEHVRGEDEVKLSRLHSSISPLSPEGFESLRLDWEDGN